MGTSIGKKKLKVRQANARGEGNRELNETRRSTTVVRPSGADSRRKKGRMWVQPKDKSNARKAFLKVRDAKARSHFEKLRKKQRGESGGLDPERVTLKKPAVSVPDSREEFLDRLLDPFAPPSVDQKNSPPLTQPTKGTRPQEYPAQSPAKEKTVEAEGAPHSPGAKGQSHLAWKSSDLNRKKEYAPFVQARKKFEEAKRAAEEAAAAAAEEAEKKAKERKLRQREQKVTRKKLRARNSRGQPLMGKVMDVLLDRIRVTCADSSS